MKLERIEAEIQRYVAGEVAHVPEPSRAFLTLFNDLTQRFTELHQRLQEHPYVDTDTYRDSLSLRGFIFVDDLSFASNVLAMYDGAFEAINSDPHDAYVRPAVEATIALRIYPTDIMTAETMLCQAGQWPDGDFGVVDHLSGRAPIDGYWEEIRLPGADPLGFTADILEYQNFDMHADLVDNKWIPEFETLDDRFESMHAALDIIENTPMPT